jgi:hypothetical protein
MNFPLRFSLVCAAALALSSCAIFGGPADRALRRTPSYQAGYADGCAAANNASANYREAPATDNRLYESDQTYRYGWGNGYQTCKPSGVGAPGDDPLGGQALGHR